MPANPELNKLFWHSRRGMLELDLLLVPFVKEAYVNLTEAEQNAYKNLLACEDNDLYQWFMQKSTPDDPQLRNIISIILNRVQP